MAVSRLNIRRGGKRSRPNGSVSSFTKITGVGLLLLVLYLFSVFSLIRQTAQDDKTNERDEFLTVEKPDIPKIRAAKETKVVKPIKNHPSPPASKQNAACQQLLDHFRDTHKSECTAIESEYRDPPHINTVTKECETDISSSDFFLNRPQAEAFLQKHGVMALHEPITAYIEPPLQDTVPGTGSRGDLDKKEGGKNPDRGTPPDFVIPLPVRKHKPDDLVRYEYPKVQTCHDMPAKFPVDRGLEYDTKTGNPIVWNVGNTPMPPDFPQQEAPYCPVEADPFLPWIHDIFPSVDGSRIEFIAQNKRRCRTGKSFSPEVNRLVPQVSLMQSVSVERIDEAKARELAPEVWHNDQEISSLTTPRYRLAPMEEASEDGMYTRFICRFHALADFSSASPTKGTRIVGETLSAYDFNYEFVSYRKGSSETTLLTPKGKDTRLFWASNLRFHCPVPKELQDWVATGATVLSNGSPTLFVDLIPIRTSARYKELHMSADLIGPKEKWQLPAFDAQTRWGNNNVLPPVEASGRWANLPICLPPAFQDDTCSSSNKKDERGSSLAATEPILAPRIAQRPRKPHTLSACLWASAEFKTRGISKGSSTDTGDRLREWIEFHLLVGFDHIYVYDNSGAHSNTTSLQPILDLYPRSQVTRIDWPSIVCNNNIPAHDSTGERSSQYAAENSCRTRYGPFTEWIAVFDTDEYLVPMGEHTSLKQVLEKADKTNILSMRSSRGRLRLDKSDKVTDDAIEKRSDVTFLEAYNCDSAGIPKPSWADRARKQIYRTNYVLYHYVHYSTVTRGYLKSYKDLMVNGTSSWKRKFGEKRPSERVTDEAHEAVMVHTKTLMRDMTARYTTRCRHDWEKKWQSCWVAYPFPANATKGGETYGADGMEYNCYINERVEQFWIPKLREAMQKREEEWSKEGLV